MLPLETAWMAQDWRMSADIVSYLPDLFVGAGRTEVGYGNYVQYSPGGLFGGCVHWDMKLASCPTVCTVAGDHVSCFDTLSTIAVANLDSYWEAILVYFQRLGSAAPFNLHSSIAQIINQYLLHDSLIEQSLPEPG